MALSETTNNNKIINVNSSWSMTRTEAVLDSVTLNLWIYTGVKGISSLDNVALGASNDRVETPTYTLTSIAVSNGTDKQSSFEVSTLVKDFIESELNGVYNSNNTVWVDAQMICTINGVPYYKASQNYLALDGYDYTRDNSIDSSLLISNTDVLRLKGESVSIPTLGKKVESYEFEKDGVVTSSGVGINSTSSNEQIQYITDSSDADKLTIVSYPELNDLNMQLNNVSADWQIESGDTIVGEKITFDGVSGGRYPDAFRGTVGQTYVVSFRVTEVTSGFINGLYDGGGGVNLTGTIDEVGDYSITYTQTANSVNTLSFYTVGAFIGVIENYSLKEITNAGATSTTQVIEIDNVEECRYTESKLTFINKFGAFQDVWMLGNSKKAINVKSDTWNRRNLITGGGSFRPTTIKNTTNVNEKITLNSGFYPESNNVVFEELMQSNSVWLWDGSNTYPVIVKDSTFNFKDSNTDKLINYTINIEFASNKMMTL